MRTSTSNDQSLRLNGKLSGRALGAFIVAACFLAIACAPRAADAVKIRLAYLPIADAAAYFTAKDRGFFKQEGIEIEGKIIGGGAVQIPAMEGGSIDVGWSASASLIQAHAKGFDMLYFAPGHPLELEPNNVGAAWLAQAGNASISSLKSLKGKKVAINKFGSINDLGLRALLAKAGLPLKAVRIVEIPFPQMNQALLQGRVDVIGQVEPFVTLLRLNKKSKVVARGIMGGTIGPRWQISGMFTKRSWLAKNPAAAKAFVRAITGAVKYINSHPGEMPGIIAANTRMKADLVKQIVRSAHPTAFHLPDLQLVIDAAAKLKMISKPFPAKEIIASIAPVE